MPSANFPRIPSSIAAKASARLTPALMALFNSCCDTSAGSAAASASAISSIEVPNNLAAASISPEVADAARAFFSHLPIASQLFPVAATPSLSIIILSASEAIKRSTLLSCVPITAFNFAVASAAPSNVSNCAVISSSLFISIPVALACPASFLKTSKALFPY